MPRKAYGPEQIIGMLCKAYWMEIETVMSYLANSVNPDGVRAQEIVESLRSDIQEELGHATQFATRIKELYGVVPGSMDFKAEQSYLQPPERQSDIVHVIKGVIAAETGAIVVLKGPRTVVNSTIVSSNITFPLNQPIFVDASHDTAIASSMSDCSCVICRSGP